MSRWLEAARGAKKEMAQVDHNIFTPVQKVQEVQQLSKRPRKDSYCTYCTKCTSQKEYRTDGKHAVPDGWIEGYQKLTSDHCPQTITAHRWQQYIQDAATFMCCWSEKAHALGWTAIEVFGMHPLAPANRPDAAGLVWLLNGNEIAAITTDKAIIKTKSGNSQTLVKGVTGSIPAWDLMSESKLS
ncbi:MAG: hypothetical protein V7727_11055 [Sneathiella sp.]